MLFRSEIPLVAPFRVESDARGDDRRLRCAHPTIVPAQTRGMRRGWALVPVIAVAAVVGGAISTAQRPPAPAPSPAPTRSAAPTPIPPGPISGIGFSVVDDPSSNQVVLFGGVDNYANTWLWSGRWILAAPEISPPGRIDAAAAYDPLTRQVLLFGGRRAPLTTGPLLHDTWAWDGAMCASSTKDRAAPRRARGHRWRGMTRSTRWSS